MVAYVFPGQGSQFKGMGEELFDEFKEITEIADKILGYSIKKLCLENPNGLLNNTKYTQPALYVVNAMSYLKKVRESNIRPDYVAGHSLGEYNALFAAGVFDFETGLKLVKKRGELMSEVTGGSMAAVIGMTFQEIREVIRNKNLTTLDIANHNSNAQIVIAGPEEDISNAQVYFEEAGALKYIKLNVSGAFHSHYMKEKAEEFASYLAKFKLNKFSIKVVSNVTGELYKEDEVYKSIQSQIYSYVKWNDTIKYLLKMNITEIIQVGPGKVLTSLINKIKDEFYCALEENNIGKFIDKTLTYNNFTGEYKVKYPYVIGGIERGISSKEMIVKSGTEKILSFLGTKKMDLDEIEESIIYIKDRLTEGEPFGINITYDYFNSEISEKIINLCLKYNVKNIEVSGYTNIPNCVIRYKLEGIKRKNGSLVCENRVFYNTARLNIEELLKPISESTVKNLSRERINYEDVSIFRNISIIDGLTIKCDGNSNNNGFNILNILPVAVRVKNKVLEKFKYMNKIYIGVGGGIGNPEALAVSFMLGADYVVTDSINQCSIEANCSELVKDLLEQVGFEDTIYVPDAERFEIGGKVQVLKKGVMFPSRANKLYELYRQYDSYYEIDEKLRSQVEKKFFMKSFEEYYDECKKGLSAEEINIIEKDEKKKMAVVFKRYLTESSLLAQKGVDEQRMNFQIYCSPAIGVFNNYVKDSELKDWRKRSVTKIAEVLMNDAKKIIESKITNGIVNL
ncbi:ACP S-malonyltransferase [Clostridium saccharoperbutylacetonicum]